MLSLEALLIIVIGLILAAAFILIFASVKFKRESMEKYKTPDDIVRNFKAKIEEDLNDAILTILAELEELEVYQGNVQETAEKITQEAMKAIDGNDGEGFVKLFNSHIAADRYDWRKRIESPWTKWYQVWKIFN